MTSIFEICSSDSQTPSSSPRNSSNRSLNSSEIISFSSTTSDVFYSQVSTSFSTPKYKSPCRFSTDRIEEAAIIDDSDFQSYYYQPSLQRGSGEQQINLHECRPRCWRSFSSEDFRSIGLDQPLLDMPLMVDSAKRYVINEESENWGSGYDSDQSTADRHQRMTNRPKPYQAFLGEIKRKELEEQINAWTEAKQQKLMNRLTTQDAVIHAWELKQTMKATIEMKKIESKLERRRAKAIEKMQKKISNSRRKANKMKARERQTIENKLTTISRITDKVRDTGKFIWVKFSCCW